MKAMTWLAMGFLFAPLSSGAMAEDVLRVGTFNRDALNVLADEKGFLKKENIRVELNLVTNSVDLMRNLISEKYDLIHTNADNVIAWAEGQGEDPQPNDFVIFLGGNHGVGQRLVVAPAINNLGDLKGKVLAVDDPRTGYAAVLVYMLKQNGLTLNKDYSLKPFGNTTRRADAMSKGEAAAALMNMPEDEIAKRGFKTLARSEDYVPVYARGVGTARRPWADQNEALLVRYIRALVSTTNWLLDPKNKEEALKLLLPANQNSAQRAAQMYREAVDPKLGFNPGSRIDFEGIKMVLQLREVMGAMKPPLPPAEKYVDDRFYKKAAAALSR